VPSSSVRLSLSILSRSFLYFFLLLLPFIPLSYELERPAGTFVVLHERGDEPADWLRAGEALAAAWLVATEMHVSVLPLSAPIQRPATRDALGRMVGDPGHPYLVVRLGRSAGPALVPHSTRLPVDQIVEVRSTGR